MPLRRNLTLILKRTMNILKSLAALICLIFVSSVSALELNLAPGEIVDLGWVKKDVTKFDFDKVVLKNNSMIMIPRSMRKAELNINELSSQGLSLIYIYDDELDSPRSQPITRPKADRCEPGAKGSEGYKGATTQPFELNLSIGFKNAGKIVLIADGGQGKRGSKGGIGQEGGDSGGGDRCVLHRCNGGRGGDAGRGGEGGDGGDGSKINLKYSGIAANDISVKTTEDNVQLRLVKRMAGTPIKEKKIYSDKKESFGFVMLQGSVGTYQTLLLREGTIPTDPFDDLADKTLTILVRGGVPGSGGDEGSPGMGGAGYNCSIGPDQSVGDNGLYVTYGPGPSGKEGKAGIVGTTKTD